jgi:hypothetical protein
VPKSIFGGSENAASGHEKGRMMKSLAITAVTLTALASVSAAAAEHSTGHALMPRLKHRTAHIRTTPQVSKCLCGYGVSGYDSITCVPVKDCELEHATCRSAC